MASKDVIINYAGDSSALDAASKKAQASVDGVSEAVERTAKAQEKAEVAAVKAADAVKAASAKATAAVEAAAAAQAAAVEKAGTKEEGAYKKAAAAAEKAAEKASAAVKAASEKSAAAQDKAADAAKAAAKAAEKAAQKEGEALEDGFGKAGQASAKMVGLLQKVSPEAAGAASGVNDLADAGEVMSESLAAVGVTGGVAAAVIAAIAISVGLLIGAYNEFNGVSASALAATEAIKEAEINRLDIIDATKLKTIELQVATGQLTAEQGTAATEAIKSAQAQADALKPLSKSVQSLIDQQDDWSTAAADAASYILPSWTPLGYAVRGLADDTDDLNAALKREVDKAGEVVAANDAMTASSVAAANQKQQEKEALEDIARAESEAAKRKAEAEKAAAALKKRIDELNAAMKEENDGAEKTAASYHTLMQSLIDMEDADGERAKGAKSASEKITDAYEDEQDAIEETRRQLIALALTEAAVAQANIEADNAAAANKKKWVAQQTELLNESKDAQTAAQEDANIRIADLQQKQNDIFAKGVQDRKDMVQEDRDNAISLVTGTIAFMDVLLSAALDSQMSAVQDTGDSLDNVRSLLDDLETDTVDAASLSGEALVDAYKSGEVAAEDLSESQKEYLQSQLANEEDVLAARLRAEEEGALKTWKIQKDLALASATIQAAGAVLAGLAIGPISGILAGIAAAASIATIATSQPPSFREGYFGGPMGQGGSIQPDQRLAWIEPDSEVVMPSQGVQAAGGRDAARAQAAGIPPMSENTTVVRFGHREISRIVSSPSARKGILDASVRPRGRGNRYKKVQ